MWSFGYTKDEPRDGVIALPETQFAAKMPVPGYWDDHTDRLSRTIKWSRDYAFNPDYRATVYPMGAGKPADCSLPYILGTGWYKKSFMLPQQAQGSKLELICGGAVVDTFVWINGVYLGEHRGHQTPFSFPFEKYAKFGEVNTVVLAVSNVRGGIGSCILRGYKGRSAGIYGDVRVHIAEQVRIEDLFVVLDANLEVLNWSLSLRGDPAEINGAYAVLDGERIVLEGRFQGSGSCLRWQSTAAGLAPWSDNDPKLYTIEVALDSGDQVRSRFGLRYARQIDGRILINGREKLLRGYCEHAYFAKTCTQSLDKAYYMDLVTRCKQIGFNFARFHTWSPNEQYLEACDELGLYVQVEAANFSTPEMWQEMVKTYRRHPSVVLFCRGNEIPLDDEQIEICAQFADVVHDQAPGVLYSPMESLHCVDFLLNIPSAGTHKGLADTPFLHDPYRLDRLKAFSDVLEPHRHIGFDTVFSKLPETRRKFTAYNGTAYISHELGILDTYIDLGLEYRYEGTRIGTDLYRSVREMMQEAGILENAPLYYENSCKWTAALRKMLIEKVRLTDAQGYNYLGAIDYQWHRGGYSCGFLNEFYEMKPGQSREQMLMYNGESLVMLDIPPYRAYTCGEQLSYDCYLSLYGGYGDTEGVLSWKLKDRFGKVCLSGRQECPQIREHAVDPAGAISFALPSVKDAQGYVLCLQFSSEHYDIFNEYRLWAFPQAELDASVPVVQKPDLAVYEQIAQGARMVILGDSPLPMLPTDYDKIMAGRTVGNSATVVHPHPIMNGFPHEGWCDQQFVQMLQGGKAAVFNDRPDLFRPVIEVVSSYKLPFTQAALYELRIGKGRALFCTLNMSKQDPAAQHLLGQMCRYLAGEVLQDVPTVELDELRELFEQRAEPQLDFDAEKGIDGNALVLQSQK